MGLFGSSIAEGCLESSLGVELSTSSEVARKYISSPVGEFLAVATSSGLRYLDLIPCETSNLASGRRTSFFRRNPNRQLGRRHWISCEQKVDSRALEVLELLETELRSYFARTLTAFSIPLDIEAHTSRFKRAVWEAARAIPYGSKVSYAQLAETVARPRAARAVGRALAWNPVLIVIPCHRVVRSNGETGGFVSGARVKEFLLALESGRQL
ncbi:MAG: methylated-DNA--[protein]-cysteine S-methyltransferase [Acidimicrobiia bacterium]